MFRRLLRGLTGRRHDHLRTPRERISPRPGKNKIDADQDELVASAFFLFLSPSLCAACHGVVTSDTAARATHVCGPS